MKVPRGMSFLEIVVSVTILIIVFFTVYRIFITGYRFFKTTQSSTTLTKLAQAKLEEIALKRTTATTGWLPFPQDPIYQYQITAEDYTQASFPSHYSETPVTYDLRRIILTARGPMNPNGTAGSITRTIVLKTLVSPEQTFYPGKCAPDKTVETGASTWWKASGE